MILLISRIFKKKKKTHTDREQTGDCLGLEEWELGDGSQGIQTSNEKMSKFWGTNLQHDDCSERHRIVYSKGTKRVDLHCPHHTHEHTHSD